MIRIKNPSILNRELPKNTVSRKKNAKEESLILKSILTYLKIKGICAWRQNVSKIKINDNFVSFGFKGMSDIIGILPNGKFLAIEVKSAKGKLSVEQKAFMEMINTNCGVSFVAHSVQDVEYYLTQFLGDDSGNI